jgi:Zn-dependent protease
MSHNFVIHTTVTDPVAGRFPEIEFQAMLQENCIAIENAAQPRYRLHGINMAWEDRDYYRSGERWGGYLGNPATVFGFSVPFLRFGGISTRLTFWLLLEILFMYMDVLRGISAVDTTVAVILLIATLIAHEFGHRFFARRVGGDLSEFLLWPAGGMNPPTAPARPSAKLQAFAGGIIVNIVLAIISAVVLVSQGRLALGIGMFNPVLAFFTGVPVFEGTGRSPLIALTTFFFINLNLVLINLFPFYWFDGGYLLEAILWRPLGRFRAINATCITGMVVAVPLFLLCLYGKSFLGMAVCALMFAGSYVKRRELKASGGAEFGDMSDLGSSWSDSAGESTVRRKPRWPARNAVKKAAAERHEQEKIDAILAKVHAQGMQSLNWMERRTLRKATERQRAR